MENTNINNNIPSYVNELEVLASLQPGDKLQLTTQTTWARRQYTGANTTFMTSLGKNGSIAQGVSRWVTGASHISTISTFKEGLHFWIKEAGKALASSNEISEKAGLEQLLERVKIGLTHLSTTYEGSERDSHKNWVDAAKVAIDQIKTFFTPDKTFFLVGEFEKAFEALATLQPGEKIQRFSETTTLRRLQQDRPTRILKSLGNSQSESGKLIQNAARQLIGADTTDSAYGFEAELKTLLSQLKTFISEVAQQENATALYRLNSLVDNVEKGLATLRDTHDPALIKRLRDLQQEIIDIDLFCDLPATSDLIWAETAERLRQHVHTKLKKDNFFEKGSSKSVLSSEKKVASPVQEVIPLKGPSELASVDFFEEQKQKKRVGFKATTVQWTFFDYRKPKTALKDQKELDHIQKLNGKKNKEHLLYDNAKSVVAVINALLLDSQKRESLKNSAVNNLISFYADRDLEYTKEVLTDENLVNKLKNEKAKAAAFINKCMRKEYDEILAASFGTSYLRFRQEDAESQAEQILYKLAKSQPEQKILYK